MIRYRSLRHWRFILAENYSIQTPIFGCSFPDGDDPAADRFHFSIEPGGLLVIRKGYCWDGPSGPVPAWRSSLRPSLVHDALYQLLRLEVLPAAMRAEVDRFFHRLCRESGMRPWLAWCFHKAVRWFGSSAASEEEPYPTVRQAP